MSASRFLRISLVSALILGSIIFFATQGALAQTGLDTGFITNPKQTFCSTPGGSKTGELYINTPVIVEEVVGDWAKVSVRGWVRMDSIGRKTASTGQTASIPQSSELAVVDFSVKEVKEGLPKPRLYLKLKVRNDSGIEVRTWRGMLIASDKSGRVLFRENVVDDQAKLAPKAVGEINFYWEPEEDPYDKMLGATKDNTDIKLFKVKLNQ